MLCSTSAAAAGAAAVAFESAAGPIRVSTEVAADEMSRLRGLMFRKQLPEQAGMLFVFPQEAPRSFWMKNTYLSLDLIFISAQRRVVGIVARAEPMTLTPRGLPQGAQYVLEVNGGFAARHGIETGAHVTLENIPPGQP